MKIKIAFMCMCALLAGSTYLAFAQSNEPEEEMDPNDWPQGVYILKTGTGSGRVSAGAFSCGEVCDEFVDTGTKIVFTAEPDDNSIFTGWSGACAGIETGADCPITVNQQVVVSANFDLIKKPKPVLGISAFGSVRTATKNPFTGTALGSHWRIGGSSADPVAQGTFVDKGSRLGIRLKLYAGSVYAQFDSNKSNWVANYYAEAGSQRGELYSDKSGMYQEEMATGADGATQKIALLSTGQTLFGTYESGSFFIVNSGALPTASPASWAGLPIPYGKGPFIPMKKIIDLLTQVGIAVRDMFVNVAYAAAQSLKPSQVFEQLSAYKKVMADMQSMQEKFATFDFNDPNLDYTAVQGLIDAYDVNQKKLDSLVVKLGRERLFVRSGSWLTEASAVSESLVDSGIDSVPAALIGQVSGSFDFYTVQAVGGKNKLFVGTCAGVVGQATCELRTPTTAQSKALLSANDVYRALAAQAQSALGNIESVLFAQVE